MSDQDMYEQWKRARAEGAVPEGFTERVVAAAARAERRSPTGWMVTLAVVASTAFVVRIAALLLIFVTA